MDSGLPLHLLSSTEVWNGLPCLRSSQGLHPGLDCAYPGEEPHCHLGYLWLLGLVPLLLPCPAEAPQVQDEPCLPLLQPDQARCHGDHLWATGKLTLTTTMSDAPYLNLAMALLLTHYRIPHFHLIHRAMHPWKTTSFPDIGKFLYRQVHSLHHKSYNPTAFSGTNMHPVESTLYYSAALIPVAFGLHPVHALGVIVDCAMGAWLGHDGFQWP